MLEHIDLAPVPDAAQLLDDAQADADAFGQKLNTTYDYAAPIARLSRREPVRANIFHLSAPDCLTIPMT